MGLQRDTSERLRFLDLELVHKAERALSLSKAPILSPTDQARAATGTSLSHWEVEMVICSPPHRRDCQSQRQGVTQDGTEQDENRALRLHISCSLQSFLFPSSPSTQHRGGCKAMGFKSWTT